MEVLTNIVSALSLIWTIVSDESVGRETEIITLRDRETNIETETERQT